MLEYLTYEDFRTNAERNPGGHWATYERRWEYHAAAIRLIQQSGVSDPSKVLEMGTMGASLVKGSDTIDFNWEFEGKHSTYAHDARKIPWPVMDKQYELFICLRVFHYLKPVVRECFQEALRVAKSVLIGCDPLALPNKPISGIQIRKQFTDWGIRLPMITEMGHEMNTQIYYWHGKQAAVLLRPDNLAQIGHACFFFSHDAEPSSDDWGIKGYRLRGHAEIARDLQQRGYKAGVAPPAGEVVSLILRLNGAPHPWCPYGYETGVCNDSGLDIESPHEVGRVKLIREHLDLYLQLRDVFPPGGPELAGGWNDDLVIDGVTYSRSKANDFIPSNLGLYRGKLVCVDWL